MSDVRLRQILKRRKHTLQFVSSEVLDHIGPVWRIIKSSQIWLQLSTQDLESRALSNTVRSHQTKNLTWTGRGQSMELETVGRVSVRDLGLEICRKIDDGNSSKRTFFRADTTSNAQVFRYEGDF